MIRHALQYGCLAGSAETLMTRPRRVDAGLKDDVENAAIGGHLELPPRPREDDLKRGTIAFLGQRGACLKPLKVQAPAGVGTRHLKRVEHP